MDEEEEDMGLCGGHNTSDMWKLVMIKFVVDSSRGRLIEDDDPINGDLVADKFTTQDDQLEGDQIY